MSPTKDRRTADKRGGRGARELVRAIVDPDRPARTRVAAIEEASRVAVSYPTVMNALLQTVEATDAPVSVRRAALRSLRANSFRTAPFVPFRADYLRVLRSIATDADEEIRASALEVLAAVGDEHGQRLLVDGLRDPDAALVDPATAVGMLGADIHNQNYDLLRELATSDDPAVRRSALRVLAADSRAVNLFQRIATDKNEDRDARATSAIALQSLAPNKFKKVAEDVALDDNDYPEIRATLLNALAHDPNVRPGRRLRDQLDTLETAPEDVRQAAKLVADRETQR
jgi:HEAT repeat protein